MAAIVTASSEAIMSTTLDGVITSWNPAAQRLYGYAPAEAVGQSVRMLAPPDRTDELADLWAGVRRGESVTGYETVRLTRDGRRIDVALTLSPVHDAGGQLIAFASIARDVTELRRLERERDRLYTELEGEFARAAEIQAQLLPHPVPDLPGYDFAGTCLPARQVGGDFYD